MAGFGIVADISAIRKMGRDIDRYISVSEVATTRVIKRETNTLKNDVRDDVRSAGLGTRMANTWQGKSYPDNGKPSLNGAGFVYSRAPHIIQAYEQGVSIVAKGGRYLAIPTQNAPKRAGRQKMTPKLYEATRGKLQFVKLQNGNAMLIAEVQASYSKKTGQFTGFRKASAAAKKSGRSLASVVMFVLVPTVRVSKRLQSPSRHLVAAVERLSAGLYEEKRKILRS